MDSVLIVFLITAAGCAIGKISVKGIRLGASAVLIAALLFGHFGFVVPALVKNLGLALFACSIGLTAGPSFFKNLKNKALSYIITGGAIILTATVLTAMLSRAFDLPARLAVGVFSGAMSSTPSLAAALEIDNNPLISVGYGVAYLYGVVGVVLFVQILPAALGIDIQKEAASLSRRIDSGLRAGENLKPFEQSGFLVFSVTMVLGALIGKISAGGFSLGMTGGPLCAGILAGHFNRFKNISFRIPDATLSVLRDLGLMLFLTGAGTEAGQGFAEVFKEYGALLFALGAVITTVPMFVGFFVSKLLKMDIITALGSICGGMTSTPALGALISSAENESVSADYAGAYPSALIFMIIATQLLMRFL